MQEVKQSMFIILIPFAAEYRFFIAKNPDETLILALN
tara:strand:- start:4925 stop:5035 length:111 start_codon:yes stop_codon:yes gene_type:complete